MKKKNPDIKKIVIFNQKGGVGKTATTVNLSYILATHGFKTLVVDMDSQAHLSKIYAPELNGDNTIGDLLSNKKANINDFVHQAQLSIDETEKVDDETVYKEKLVDVENLFIIPSNIHLAMISERLISSVHREKLLHNHIKKVVKDFDYILFDCPPALNVLTQNAIFTADTFLIPTDYGSNSLDGIQDLFDSIDEVLEGTRFHYRVLRSMKSGSNKKTNRMIEEQLEVLQDALMETVIRRNEPINQAQTELVPVYMFDKRCNGSQDYLNLMQEVLRYE